MSKAHLKLLFLILFISNTNSQENNDKILFVGHAYGSHKLIDNKLDSNFLNFNNENNNRFKKIVLGGDFIYDCSNENELNNLYDFYEENNVNFVIGNHDNCQAIFKLIQNSKESLDYHESYGKTLIFYLNTSIEDLDKIKLTKDYVDKTINQKSPKNIIIFSHQVIFSKSDWYLRVNSRKYYQYGINLYNYLYDKYHNSDYNFYFVAGDIGAFNYTPYSFHENDSNFNLLAAGIGNDYYSNGIVIEIGDNINTKFIDLKSGNTFDNKKYSKTKVQVYQFPKLILSIIKRNYLLFIPIILLIILVYLRSNYYKKNE